MNNKTFFFFFSFFLLIFLGSFVSAGTIGMGVKWYTESEFVQEGTIKCVSYGLYNPAPFDVPVNGYLEATDELENLYVKNSPILVPVNTSSGNAISKEICFNIPKVYEENCILGAFCERKCPAPSSNPEILYPNEKRFKGDVVGRYEFDASVTGGTGSSTGSSVAVPLEMIVLCQSKERDQTAFYATIAVIIIAIFVIIWLLTRKSKKHKK